MGVSDSLNTSGDGAFEAYMWGIKAADKYLRDNRIDAGKIDMSKLMSSYAKQYIALSMDDRELWCAANEDRLDALNPPVDKNGKVIRTKEKSPSLEIYLNRKDNQDYDNGKFTTTEFIDKHFNHRTFEL